MDIEFTGRKIVITPALRRYTEEKLRKLERLLDGIIEAHVIFRVEKHRQSAEIVVRSPHATLSGTETTSDLYASIVKVVEKLEKQAKKRKEKLSWGKKKIRGATSIRSTPEPVPDEPPQRPIGPRVIRTRRYAVKPMSVDEAVLQVQSDDSTFIVFRDSVSQKVSVLYRRSDGNFGLIEPEI